MVYILLSLVVSLPTFASTTNIGVKCALEGPVFSGQIEYPQDVSSWIVTGGNETGNRCELTMNAPLLLRFNNLTYVSASNPAFGWVKPNYRTCSDDLANGSFLPQEAMIMVRDRTGFKAQLQLNVDRGGLFRPSIISKYDGTENCDILPQ